MDNSLPRSGGVLMILKSQHMLIVAYRIITMVILSALCNIK